MTRRYLLDTGPAFNYLFGRKGARARVGALRRAGIKVGICMPVLGEIVGGLEASVSRDRSWAVARPRLNSLICWPFDKKAAYAYGRVFAELRARGRLMQSVDVQLAAIAMTLGNCTVATVDSDLEDIPGLRVENWSSQS